MVKDVEHADHAAGLCHDNLNGASTSLCYRPARLSRKPTSKAALAVIDIFALALVHGLLAVALLRLLGRPDLDSEPELERRRRSARSAPDA